MADVFTFNRGHARFEGCAFELDGKVREGAITCGRLPRLPRRRTHGHVVFGDACAPGPDDFRRVVGHLNLACDHGVCEGESICRVLRING